jgi:hypothetical protein
MPEPIETRQDMAPVLIERMRRTYEALADRQELEPDTSLVKTYLIEAHLDENANSNDVLRLLRTIFSSSLLRTSAPVQVQPAPDDTLFLINLAVSRERRRSFSNHNGLMSAGDYNINLAHSTAHSESARGCHSPLKYI